MTLQNLGKWAIRYGGYTADGRRTHVDYAPKMVADIRHYDISVSPIHTLKGGFRPFNLENTILSYGWG